MIHLGIDIGTSGVRALAIDAQGAVVGEARAALPPPLREGAGLVQDPELWWQQVSVVLDALGTQAERARIAAIAVDGTSGTLLLTDAEGRPLAPATMYNDASCADEAAAVSRVAPPTSAAHGASSPLARLLRMQRAQPAAAHALHQADWIAGRLAGRFGVADENNVLKLGYDVVARRWPDWFDALGVRRTLLPQVVPPGEAIGTVAPAIAERFGLPRAARIVAGTTDGVAAFLATGASQVGDAVTSLGSTLVVKLLSDRPVFAPEYGLYSHRLCDLWLPGGASNSGGAALLRHFSAEQMAALTPRIEPERPTGLDYYPLPAPGERFPINDPQLAPRIAPRPDDDARFFQGLLEGIAAVEKLAYDRIAALGAPAPTRVFSVGGGARNAAWSRIRARGLGVPVPSPAHEEAAYGSALLAQRGAA